MSKMEIKLTKRLRHEPMSTLTQPCGRMHRTTGTGLTDAQIVAQSNMFMLAGYDTTANALAFAVYLLAAHPSKLALFLEEVDQWTASKGLDAPLYDAEVMDDGRGR